jgi:hypothetical protein
VSLHHSETRRQSNIEELLQLLYGIVWVLDRVTDGSRIVIDLPVIAPLVCCVTEEVDVLVMDSRESFAGVSFRLDVL